MIQRSIAITIVLLLALTTTYCDARLLHGGLRSSSKEISSKDRKLTAQEQEKEDDELLSKIDKEYSMYINEESKQKANQDMDMAFHNRVLPTHLLLEEVKVFDKILLDEEIMIAKELLLLEKEQQSNDNDNEIIKINQVSSSSSASSSITRMKSEYDEFEKMKESKNILDRRVIEYVNKEVTNIEHEENKLYITKEEEEENKITNENKEEEEKILHFEKLQIEEEKKLQQQSYLEMEKQQKQIDDKHEQLIKQSQIAITMSLLY